MNWLEQLAAIRKKILQVLSEGNKFCILLWEDSENPYCTFKNASLSTGFRSLKVHHNTTTLGLASDY